MYNFLLKFFPLSCILLQNSCTKYPIFLLIKEDINIDTLRYEKHTLIYYLRQI